MKREDLLKEMKEGIGTKDPVIFFDKMVDIFDLLFNKIELLEKDLRHNTVLTSLAIQWDPQIASAMLATQIQILRQNKDTFYNEISSLKDAYAKNIVTQRYDVFCKFWVDTLGWHPFLEYDRP